MSRFITDAFSAAGRVVVLGALTIATVFVFFNYAPIEIDRPHPKPAIPAGASVPSPLEKMLRNGGFTIIAPNAFQDELMMTPKELMDRWNPFVAEASKRFGVPQAWIRSVMARESGGRTMMDIGTPITSKVGAMGLMQVMPQTYAELSKQLRLKKDAYDPHDNIIAGAAYLQWLHAKYGYPAMFAAYNDGPGNYDLHLAGKRDLPAETVAYVKAVSGQNIGTLGVCRKLAGKRDHRSMAQRLRLHCGALGYEEIAGLLAAAAKLDPPKLQLH